MAARAYAARAARVAPVPVTLGRRAADHGGRRAALAGGRGQVRRARARAVIDAAAAAGILQS